MNPAEALRSAAFETLEEGMFLFIDPAEAAPAPPLRYRMSIEGGACAEVGIAVDPGVARAIAGGLLGQMAEDVAEEDVGPAVAEALNVVAGAIVARILGAGGEFELRPPVSGGTPIGEVCAFNADGGQVQLWWAA